WVERQFLERSLAARLSRAWPLRRGKRQVGHAWIPSRQWSAPESRASRGTSRLHQAVRVPAQRRWRWGWSASSTISGALRGTRRRLGPRETSEERRLNCRGSDWGERLADSTGCCTPIGPLGSSALLHGIRECDIGSHALFHACAVDVTFQLAVRIVKWAFVHLLQSLSRKHYS